MYRFHWPEAEPPPAAWDLRRKGWQLILHGESLPASCLTLLAQPALADAIERAGRRAATILLGIESSAARAQWLAMGFGDALPRQLSLDELDLRARRLHHALDYEPRRRCHGALELDLLMRDGTVNGRRIGLHPREFSLLWRLAQTPGRGVPPDDLLAEVWRMSFKPETNSLAVHVCRLRAKLASAGLGGIVTTTPDGGYALSPVRGGPDPLQRRLAMEEEARHPSSDLPARKARHEA
ncbi:winged helix-turn-helix domain-containing protein [Novosphingobium sp. TH158]|uniref:winged helix-turn-helix domain-containing protein n=1 Tax=Novosphingobium sp. TH158 TaxID=2067455 RepID=UPI001181C732|nr:winged helix-turn-helix domain-containing protein [Novosphingobium sp. TH158]